MGAVGGAKGQKVNVTGIPTPESKSKLITYRYRQTPPPQGFFPSPRFRKILVFYVTGFSRKDLVEI